MSAGRWLAAATVACAAIACGPKQPVATLAISFVVLIAVLIAKRFA